MPSVYADLHTHSRCSDGHDAPTALVRKAANHDIRVLSVTDHDTVAAWHEVQQAAAQCGIRAVAGTELSVTVDDDEVHLLAYGFDPEHPGLREHFDAFVEARDERMREMVGRLQAAGIDIAEDDVPQDDARAIGRPHVAAALVAVGAVDTAQEAFDRYLTPGTPGFVPKPPVPAEDALTLVHDAGGIGVLAHPGHWTPSRHVVSLIRAGLDGIEIVHPSHDDHLRGYYRRLAERNDLLQTGGSDYHGRTDQTDRLGRFGLSRGEWERVQAALSYHRPQF